MEIIKEKRLIGERALFKARDLQIEDCIFADGESPLKESQNIHVLNSSFQWKYPFWYSKDIFVKNSSFFEMGRAGIWYSENISLEDVLYSAPKGFRRTKNIKLINVDFPHADETLWNCENIKMNNISAKGDYFAMGSKNIKVDGFNIVGNYSFDSCSNIEIKNAKMISKDSFWNCENVIVENAYISGEYIGWNSKNVTFVDCTIESLQGFCYMKNLVLKNCRILNTTLAFEYSTVDVDVITSIDSIKNPISGKIVANKINEIIFDDLIIKKENTKIVEKII